MLEKIIKCTDEYLEIMPKDIRKKYGQFFTSLETAKFMAGQFNIPQNKNLIRILDAGAGTGILACAVIERILEDKITSNVELICYETDENVIGVLQKNLELISSTSSKITYKLKNENYITSQYQEFNGLVDENSDFIKYDLIIGNPPYRKISKELQEAKSMQEVCFGAPNLYFLFASMGAFNLKENGEMVYIIPRSWTSGAYFKKFREYFLNTVKIHHIHLFISRNKVFDKESVLQETIIIKVAKLANAPREISMTTSISNQDFENITSFRVPYDLIVNKDNNYIYLVTNIKELETLKKINVFTSTLPDNGLKMRTGLTVDFRNRNMLRNEEEEGTVPLFYAQHILNGEVKFPINKENEFVLDDKQGLIQNNKNYLFVKRFTAKEEGRRLQCGVYLSKKYNQYKKISTQNKINFIEGITSDLSECIVFGLYVLFNSSIYDEYYRILNGSTQVNSTEINSMPIPNLEIIQQMGKKIMLTKDLSVESCNNILEVYCE